MGMFDHVRCEMPIPGPMQPKHPYFQTKDFSCEMDVYDIKADGTLWRTEWWDGSKSPPHEVPFHGMLNFYTFEGGGGKEDGMWFEYMAKFTDGRCVGIDCVEISRCPFGKPRELLYPTPSQGEKSGE